MTLCKTGGLLAYNRGSVLVFLLLWLCFALLVIMVLDALLVIAVLFHLVRY